MTATAAMMVPKGTGERVSSTVGRHIEAEALTNGTAEDAPAVLSGIDLAALRDALPGAELRAAAV